MSDRALLITGCSSGIGLDAARAMRDRGWRVFASCRQEADCARLRGEGFEAPRIDYEDSASIHAALDEVLAATGGRLDAVFHNGAYAIPGPVEDLPTDALRAIFEANLFGWHTLTRAVLPVMRAQGHGRLVMNSSVLGFIPAPWRGGYNATKHALEGLTATLRVEMRGTGIHVSLIQPGPIDTDFRKNAVAQFEKWVDWENSARADQYRESLLAKLYQGSPGRFELPPSAVTAKLVHALEHPRPRPCYPVTTPTRLMGAAKRLMPARAMDWLLSRV